MGQLNAYNTMYFDRNIDLSEKISMAKKVQAIICRTATKDKTFFNIVIFQILRGIEDNQLQQDLTHQMSMLKSKYSGDLCKKLMPC